jgi:hypothetical protein
VDWVPVRDVPRLIADRQITDGDTLVALSLALSVSPSPARCAP